MSKTKEYPTMERLSETWMVLYDLSQLPVKQMDPKDRAVLDVARYIVNRIQVRVYDLEKKKAASVGAPAADTTTESDKTD